MELVAKRFNELSLDEYHELLKLRCAVFLVEQQSPYQEVDDADKEAIHLYFRNDEGALAAYARVLPAGVTHPTASIGRVIAVERGCGMGRRIMEEAIRVGEKAGIPVIISHLKVIGKQNEGLSQKVLQVIEEANARGVKVRADQYPYLR